MKKIQNVFSIASLVMLMAIAFSMSGCEKEVVQAADASNYLLPGKYHRIVTLTEGANSATFELACDNEAKLESMAATAQLVVFKNLPQANAAQESVVESAQKGVPAMNWEPEDLHICMISKQAALGVQGISLQLHDTPVQSGKVETWASGTFNHTAVFHSYSSPHLFHFYPISYGATLTTYYSHNGANNWIPIHTFWTHFTTFISNYDNSIDFAVKVQSSLYKMVWDV